MKRYVYLSLFLVICYPLNAEKPRLLIGDFSSNNIDGWQQKSFAGNTEYNLFEQNGETVLLADSQHAASAYYCKIKVDLTKTPYLNWSWQKRTTLNPGDENLKQGDDFVARIYVIKDGGLFVWKTRAINYVWSYHHKKNEQWDNPFAGDNARMIAVRDKMDNELTWYTEKRNIIEDFKQQFGIDVSEIDGVAIMTDTDNSGGEASALYGDIFFTDD